jgi:putative membrane protein
MDAVIETLMRGVPVLLAHLSITTLLFAASCLIYLKLTPHDEFALIRAGNTAAGLSVGAAFVGLALPLSFALAGSVNAFDLLLWGVLVLVLQLIAFKVVDLILKNLPKRIEDGDMAAACLLSGVKLSVAVINAAAISG